MDSNPMLSTSVWIWKELGFLDHKDNRRYIYLVPNFILNALQLSFLCFSGEEVEMLILNSYFFVLYFNCLLRVFVAMNHRVKFETFLEDFCKLYQNIMDSDDETSRTILQETSNKAETFAKLNLCLGTFASVCFVLYPLIAGLRDLPYGIYIPTVDFRLSPTYEIVFVIQAVITFSGSLLYIPFSNLFSSFIMFGIVLIKILQHKFRTIAEGSTRDTINDALIEKKFRLYIENHNRIIRYVQEMNQLVSILCLVELILFGVLISALLFLVNIVQKTSQLIIACSYIFLIMVQLFTLYWNSNELLEESYNIGVALYEIPWYHFNEKNKKTLLLVLCRTQKPLQIMIGNVAPITLQMFQSLLNASYTYITLLRRSLKNT